MSNTTNIPYISSLISLIHSEYVLLPKAMEHNKGKRPIAGRNALKQLEKIIEHVMTAGCRPEDIDDLMMYNWALQHYIEYLIYATHHLCKIDTVSVAVYLASVASDVAEELGIDISQAIAELCKKWGDEEDCDNPQRTCDNPQHDAECNKEYDDF